MKKFIKSNIKFIFGIVLGIIFSATTVYAATILFNADAVGFDNSGTTLNSTNVQDALDELYTKADSDYFFLKKYRTFSGTPTNYTFDGTNAPTTSSSVSAPLDKNVYLGLYSDGQYGVCIIRNGDQHCFRQNNWLSESKHIQEVFSDISCTDIGTQVGCQATEFYCYAYANGRVGCLDRIDNKECTVYSSENVNCSNQ